MASEISSRPERPLVAPALRPELPGLALAAGDAAAIFAFAMVGLVRHSEGITIAGLARDMAPILIPWFALAPFLHTYARPGLRTLLPTWFLSAVIGVGVRTLLLGHPTGVRLLTFTGVTLGVTLVLLLAWRGLAAVLAAGVARRRDTSKAAP